MRILLLGCNGQVGWELQRSLAPLGRVTALSRRGRDGFGGDLNDPEALAATIQSVSPDVVVNAAAYTAVDLAESEPGQARAVNAHAPGRLALAAKEAGCWLVHFSTDYVFDGTGETSWREDDPKAPVNFYGQTKLEGEEAILRSGCRHLVFRTSWVYSAGGNNFIRTMLKLAAERDSLRVVDDQVGAPTGAELIADVVAHGIRAACRDEGLSGTYHLAAEGETSWWNYARRIVDAALRAGVPLKTDVDNVLPVSSSEFPTVAARPRNSRLDTTRLRNAFGLHLPRWHRGVSRAVEEIFARMDRGDLGK